MKKLISILMIVISINCFAQYPIKVVTENKDTLLIALLPFNPNTGNIVPTANAGPDKAITLPVSTVTLTGSGSDVDGTIVSYKWEKVSGAGGVIGTPAAATTNIIGLTAGSYEFKLTVTDNGTMTGSDIVVVVVSPAPPNNQSPTANAGTDKTITLPTNSVSLTGIGADPDGSITKYTWTKEAGPSTFTLSNANTQTVTVSNMVVGTYIFRLTVTDNQGASGTDDVSVIVSQITPPPTDGKIFGFASDATGGTGQQTVHVTSLSGSNSLQQLIGSNRTIVFDIDAQINSAVVIRNASNLTIDGNGKNVTVTNASGDGISFQNSVNCILKGVRATGCKGDGINVLDSRKIVIDYSSAYNNTDGNIDFANSRECTMQNTFLD